MTDTFTVDPVAPERFSMSFLRSAEGCLFRAHHERSSPVTGPDALVGRIFHEVAAVVGLRCTVTGEVPTVELVTEIAHRVMGKPDDIEPLSFVCYDIVLDLLARWVPSAQFQPGEQFEISSREDLGGRTLSARIDRLLVDGSTATARDYKTGWADPAKELTIQGRIYAWHVFRREPGVERVIWSEDHIRFGLPSGPFEVTRDENARTERYLLAAIERIENAYAAGVMPASPGTACTSPGRCPLASSCPTPKWARPATFIADESEAVDQFAALLAEEARIDERKSAIRGFLLGAEKRALQHNGEEIGWSPSAGKSFDRKRLESDLAKQDGGDVDFSAYEKPTKPSFGRRKAK